MAPTAAGKPGSDEQCDPAALVERESRKLEPTQQDHLQSLPRPSCNLEMDDQRIMLRVELPLVDHATEVDVECEEGTFSLRVAHKYELELQLPANVDDSLA